MADIIVTTLLDEVAATDNNTGALLGTLETEAADGGGLSLREALQLAQDGDRVLFADDLNGVMRIDGSLASIGVTTNVSIYGDDRITISGDVDADDIVADGVTDALTTRTQDRFSDNSKIFFIYNATALTNVVLDGLTLTGGRGVNGYGGAIDAFNSAITVQGSTFAGNISYDGLGGGAIYSGSTLQIEDSTFFDNIAVDGSNTTSGHGGGAIFSNGGYLSVINTTFVENQALNGTIGTAASGGAIFADGDVYLNNVTVTGNQAQFQGGGLFATNGPSEALDDVAIFNSIILGNNANVIGPGANDELDGYDISSFTIGNSITSNANGSVTGVFAETQTIDVTNSPSTFTSGVLADNGGPVQTVALSSQVSNPALDATTIAGTDARGAARGVDLVGVANGGTSDLGAFELQEQILFAPALTSLAFTVAENRTDVGTVTATDDKAGVSFTITGGADAALFSISALTGALTFGTAPNFEAPTDANGDNQHNVTVTATDSDGLTDAQALTITVTDVNEAPTPTPAPVGPTDGDDSLVGTSSADVINALGGNDTIRGGLGDDRLIGQSGHDLIFGQGGADILRGNAGDDTLRGNGGADEIRGNGGADVIRAGGGADIVRGNGGADDIRGGGGADLLQGGGGADTLMGQGGNDSLRGNGGRDVFQFRASDRNDTILDFRQGQDMIEILNGARNFEALDIEQDGSDVLISFGTGQVRIITDNEDAFDEDDFIF